MIEVTKMSNEENPWNKFEDKNEPTVPTATLQVYHFIAQYLIREENDTHVNRASSATMCFKRRWYQANGYKATPLTPRKIVNFTLGDLTEKTVLFFIKNGCVGPGKLYSEVNFGEKTGEFEVQGKVIHTYKQENLTAEVGGITVTAHVDGWGKRNSDGKWELIEVKSAADYGFDSFKENGPGDYLKQAMVNLQTNKAKELGADSVRFFYLKKNTGHLWDQLYNFDENLFKEVIEEYKIASGKELPKTPHTLKQETFRGKPTGRTIAKFPCSYCPYLRECHGEYDVDFKGQSPIYVFKEKK
jgi:hypothetical protein